MKELEGMFKKLEKELKARILLHKVTISKSVIARKYIAEQRAQDLVLPDHYLEQNAMEYADKLVQNAMSKGMLDEVYNKAWEWAVKYMPDNFSIMEVRQNTL